MEPYAPIMVFQRLSAWQALAMPLLVTSMVVLLLTVLAWPISALVRRYYGTPYRLAGMDARAHRLVRIAALLVLRSEEHTSELQSLMRISYAVFCLKKKTSKITIITYTAHTTH